MRNVFLIVFYLIILNVRASSPPCSIWQIQVKEHFVNKYNRTDGTKVEEHVRKTFCREKWKNADFWAKMLTDSKPEKWQNSNEQFLKWNTNEKIDLLKLLAIVPSYFMKDGLTFYRARKSIILGNPATVTAKPPQIVIYDTYYKNRHKLEIVVHELAHIKYESITTNDKIEFMSLSGWTLGDIDHTKQTVELIPPTKLIKPDSAIGLDEDFANYVELYVTQPNKLKKINKILYDFFKQRINP